MATRIVLEFLLSAYQMFKVRACYEVQTLITFWIYCTDRAATKQPTCQQKYMRNRTDAVTNGNPYLIYGTT
jgi:hypothetical protein